MVRQLHHPHLIRIDNTWCLPGYLVVEMELAEGTLQDLYEAFQDEFGTPIVPEQLWLLLSHAADALDFLNARQHHLNGQCIGIQHCDIKPSNLLLFGDTVKVSDFSLASTTTSGMKVHQRSGTTDFSAPEVFQGRLSDRADQYALAVTYCQLRTGRLPFHDSPPNYSRSYVRPVPDLTMLTEAERAIIGRALAPVPVDRWPSCGHMVAQLESLVQHRPDVVFPQLVQLRKTLQVCQPANANRRASVRCRCSTRTSWRLLGQQRDESQAHILDVSNHGIGLVNAHCLKPGTILVVTPEGRPEGVSRPFLVRVVHSRQQTGGEWLHGCRFTRALDAEDLKAWLDPVVAPVEEMAKTGSA
jgi:serine/threonine protein kinase